MTDAWKRLPLPFNPTIKTASSAGQVTYTTFLTHSTAGHISLYKCQVSKCWFIYFFTLQETELTCFLWLLASRTLLLAVKFLCWGQLCTKSRRESSLLTLVFFSTTLIKVCIEFQAQTQSRGSCLDISDVSWYLSVCPLTFSNYLLDATALHEWWRFDCLHWEQMPGPRDPWMSPTSYRSYVTFLQTVCSACRSDSNRVLNWLCSVRRCWRKRKNVFNMEW